MPNARAINARMAAPGFWDNQESAQEQVDALKRLNATLKPLGEIWAAVGEDLEVLGELAEEDTTGATDQEVAATVKAVRPQVEQLELRSMMSDPYDQAGAFVQIQAGEGGTDSSDWAEMLLRMYGRGARNEEVMARR
ncbi:MAG: hypothetical protein CM1200mP2_52840 [Planctomycetaceae bacterium]|nr:MAG: hypothetical protein CM1200mP2_52840 [Planctomycetaceae bacterium]